MPSYKIAMAGKSVAILFAIAAAMNLAAAVWAPSGSLWNATRLTVSVLFLIALATYVTLKIVRWRTHEHRATTDG
ncbi:hypothetical protein [Streptomyces buecherae]|uniref:hypothetical protein n=1 Tax=Streptomyces buecherae TaxID=2763006 RepID=UPI00365F5114